jgi:hypothetical protein
MTLNLPETIEGELSEIFTAEYIEDVKAACRRYLYETSKEKSGVTEDGRRLNEIGEKARELRGLLKDSGPALDRVRLHLSEEYGRHDVTTWLEDLKEKLRLLDNMTYVNPASERARNPARGRPAGTRNTAERALAFQLWDIYKRAHGVPAGRVVRTIDVDSDNPDEVSRSIEDGPLTSAAVLLGPVLSLPSDLSRHFREIALMDNK